MCLKSLKDADPKNQDGHLFWESRMREIGAGFRQPSSTLQKLIPLSNYGLSSRGNAARRLAIAAGVIWLAL